MKNITYRFIIVNRQVYINYSIINIRRVFHKLRDILLDAFENGLFVAYVGRRWITFDIVENFHPTFSDLCALYHRDTSYEISYTRSVPKLL